MDIDKNMALRFSGYKGSFPPPENLSKAFDEIIPLALKTISPSYVSKIFPLKTEGNTLFIGSEKIESKSLSAHLKGSSFACVTILTMGFDADRLIKKLSFTDISKSHILSASLSAAAECFANELSDILKKEMAKENKICTQRFSPGYGDLPLSVQNILFSLTDCTKLTGITLTKDFFMLPSKSISSITGIGFECENE